MARIFRTEKLEINGNIRLSTEGTAGAFEIQSAGGSTLHMSKASIESDISSLAAKNTAFDDSILTDESSNNTVQAGILTEKNSDDAMDDAILAAKNADDGLDSDISDLEDANEVMDSDISSLSSAISDNDVVAKSESASEDDETATIAFGRTFSQTPAVVASLRSSNATDPVIPVMVTSVSTTNCTVSFGDGLPSDGYTVEVLASEV
jgi:hypothetical protein